MTSELLSINYDFSFLISKFSLKLKIVYTLFKFFILSYNVLVNHYTSIILSIKSYLFVLPLLSYSLNTF